MTIQNTTLPNLAEPGSIVQTPLTGYEIVDVAAGPIFTNNTVAAIADTALVDGAVTATGSNRGGAYVITAQITDVTTAAVSTGVVLPAASKPGMRRTIFNDGANAITVYANGSDTIDGTAGATGVTLTNALRCQYICIGVGKWLSAKLGATST